MKYNTEAEKNMNWEENFMRMKLGENRTCNCSRVSHDCYICPNKMQLVLPLFGLYNAD